MSRLTSDIETNEARIKNIEDAIDHTEMVRDLGPDGEHVKAMNIAIDCMRAERIRLLSHVSKLHALGSGDDLPVLLWSNSGVPKR